MTELYLPILPSSYLSYSVITTVLIGIWVVVFFNLRFGWIFSGLIVPGYLTPLLLIKPLSVGVIIFEAIVVYLLVYVISDVAAKRGLWTNFFGRDRFFLILITSVAVRLSFDGWLLPWFENILLHNYSIVFDTTDSFHSFGLIIVALIANQLWKPKLFNGLFQLFVTVGITYLITRYLLVEFTNFSISNISYTYENIASSILASPKSYIILIVTALIASRMNLFYGWEFNGILVPSLLALQWYQPSKILVSFLEAYVILFLVILILKSPIFKNSSIEGPRKILLFFNVGFIYKVALSFAILYFFPEYKVSDYFAFGYLLSSLIAVKIHDKVNMALFTRATLQTSFVSIIIATAIGYALILLPDITIFKSEKINTKLILEENNNDDLISFLSKKKIDLYGNNEQAIYVKPTPSQLEIFNKILDLIDKDFEKNTAEILNLLSQINYKITLLEKRYLVLFQDKTYYGNGIYTIDLNSKSSLSIEVPYPLKVPNTMESAIVLMKLTQAKALAISGVPSNIDDVLGSVKYSDYYSFYYNFHKHYAKNSVVEVRALTQRLENRFDDNSSKDKKTAFLAVKGLLPNDLKLSLLKEKVPNLEVIWEDVTEQSIYKDSMRDGFGQLFLSKEEQRTLISSQYYLDKYNLNKESSIKNEEGFFRNWLLNKKLEIAGVDSELYIKPSIQELLFFDKEIFMPIYENIKKWKTQKFDEKSIENELLTVSFASKLIGYTTTLYEDKTNKNFYIILHELNSTKKRYWGTYIFKIGDSSNIMIEVPRPFFESNTFEYGMELFEQLNANILAISGSHPLSNSDYTGDVLLFRNKQNIFNLANQVILRETNFDTMNILQIRGISINDLDNQTFAILATRQDKTMNKTQQFMYDYLKSHIPLMSNDGSFIAAGYDLNSTQSLYVEQSLNNTFSTLWLPNDIRYRYQQVSENSIILQQFKTLDISIIEDRLLDVISKMKFSDLKNCKNNFLNNLELYLNTRDITELEALNMSNDIKMNLVIDSGSKQPFLLVFDKNNDIYAIIKAYSNPPYLKDYKKENETATQIISRFNISKSAIFIMDKSCEK